MKKAMQKYLPDEILYRRKMGFVSPVSRWFRGPLAAEALRVTTTAFADTGWFDPLALSRIGKEHASGARDHGRLLWQLVMLERSVAKIFNFQG